MAKSKSLRRRLSRVDRAPLDNIHAARVAAKGVRAGLRLYDPHLKRWGDLDAQIREAAHALATLRDAEVESEMLGLLRARDIDIDNATIPDHRNRERPVPVLDRDEINARVSALVASCENALDELQNAPDLQPELAARPFKKALSRYRASPSDETLHSLRKRTKRLAYQLRHFTKGKHRPENLPLRKLDKASNQLGTTLDLHHLLASPRAATLSAEAVRKVEKIASRSLKRAIRTLARLAG